ncbi:eukaryotic translation initiation factor 4E-like isoform X1 [Pseudomyrmex gracilis]|uniref:eukaryotic translation initiation factor 4E-like isoform X1 n=1 Tax=Pseudomyrmex gracilis TaxID=219809 RepID=UPI000994BFB2|nr:eukaryotic translation initiation factor 4E-like isoform X1 [Pseudomyrmex gracilis]
MRHVYRKVGEKGRVVYTFLAEFTRRDESRVKSPAVSVCRALPTHAASLSLSQSGCAYCGDMATSISEELEEIDRKQNTEVATTGEFSPEYLIKHPLQNTWTLWYYEPDRNKTWEESQREITSFDTAEDFWSLYNHIKTASELRQGCDYSMFKQGIRPMWEDNQNKSGGRWLINLEKKQRATDLDNFWLEILLCMIGEAFDEYSDDVCGAVVNVRPKGDKLGVWTSNAESADSVMEIGRKLKERLKITSKTTMGYQVHKDTMVKTGSQTKNTYTL